MSSLNLENTVIDDEERRRRLAAAYRIILSAARRKRAEQKKPDQGQVSPLPLSPAAGVESYDRRAVQN